MAPVSITKKVGETPLEALERYRAEQVSLGHTELKNVPMTYAGRLDPMAEGVLLILAGDECKNKEKYLGLDKEYEVEVVFGIETDTYDALGLAKVGKAAEKSAEDMSVSKKLSQAKVFFKPYIWKFRQEYPAYSSKTVEGKQLHELARAGELPDEMPTKEVEIYSVEEVGKIQNISGVELLNIISKNISLVKGDFRQEKIIKRWQEVLKDSNADFFVLKIRVNCSSGTYMRSLAHRIGRDLGTGAFALSIKRTKIIF